MVWCASGGNQSLKLGLANIYYMPKAHYALLTFVAFKSNGSKSPQLLLEAESCMCSKLSDRLCFEAELFSFSDGCISTSSFISLYLASGSHETSKDNTRKYHIGAVIYASDNLTMTLVRCGVGFLHYSSCLWLLPNN